MPVLALDIGSSSTRAALFARDGERTSDLFAQHYSLAYRADGAATLDPNALREGVRAALAQFPSANVVSSCAFWHGLLGLDRKLEPITPIYTWADSRARDDAKLLRERFSEDAILQRTGCMIRFPFWPAKLCWLRRAERALFRRSHFWVSPADWIFHSLFGELATSASMASGTGFLDQRAGEWDNEMCNAAGIDPSQLPPISSNIAGEKVFTAIGDGAAGNIGSGATAENIAAINLGTSAAVRVMASPSAQANTRDPAEQIPFGLFRFIAGRDRFVLGGAISNAGNLHEWCRQHLALPSSAQLDRKVAARDGLIALPFLLSERSPDWPEYPGGVRGYSFRTTPLEIARAFTTSAFYRLADILELLEGSAGSIERIIVSGGMTRSPAVVRVLADALGRDLELSIDTEASLRGAALHALTDSDASRQRREHRRTIRFKAELSRSHWRRRQAQRKFAASRARRFT